MPLPNSAPYDTLATVSAMARLALGDFIQGIQPNVSGLVNTNGLTVTWVSGDKFTALLNGVSIVINSISYTIAQVLSPTTLSLISSAGVQANVGYSAVIPTGDIFSDSQAYVLPTINLAWRKLQKKLADKGHPRLESEIEILNLPVAGSLDPTTQQWISWDQFFDGVNLYDGSTTPVAPVLPPDFISPLELWERPYVTGQGQNGVVNFNRKCEMHPAPDSLVGRQKGSRNRFWDWRNDAIYLPGSILAMNLYVRYACYLPDIVQAGGGFGLTIVPILRAADALAYYAAAIFVAPRGGVIGPDLEMKGDAAVDQITNSFAKLQQRASYSRRPWGARGRRRSRIV